MKLLRHFEHYFVSAIDQYFAAFARGRALSASQQAEIAKYRRINELRDAKAARINAHPERVA